MDNRVRRRRLAAWAVTGVAAMSGVLGLASPAWADIFSPPSGATIALPTTVSGSGTAGLEIYVAAISQQAGREVTHCSTVVTPAGTYSCVIGTVAQTGQFQFVVHQFPVGQSPTPVNTFEVVSADVVPPLPVTPAGHPIPFVVAGLVLTTAGFALLVQLRRRRLAGLTR
jgi:hypothetical protein